MGETQKVKVIEVEGRIGNWMQTFTGKALYPLDPRPEDFCIEDIAHALSLLCRYGGHCFRFYSVAEHSIIVSKYVGKEHALWGLMHDASEAYIGDVIRPLKKQWPEYRVVEARMMNSICERFGLQYGEPEIVREIDNRLLLAEKAVLKGPSPQPWSVIGEPLTVTLDYWSPEKAEKEFLTRFVELTEKKA